MRRYLRYCLLVTILLISLSSVSAQDNPTCRDTITPMLVVGENARVTPGPPNNVRSEADSNSELLGQIPGGGVIHVLEGPVCGDNGIVWWRVDYNGLVGWTGEGQGQDRWIEPLTAAPDMPPMLVYRGFSDNPDDPNTLYLFDVETGTLQMLAPDLPSDARSPVLSPDGGYIAFIADDAVHVYERATGEVEPLDLAGERVQPGTHVVWSPDSQQIAFSTRLREIQRVNQDGSGQETLAFCETACRELHWSASGEELFFVEDTDGGFLLQTLDLVTGEITPHAITYSGDREGGVNVDVTADGSRIAWDFTAAYSPNLYIHDVASSTANPVGEFDVEQAAWSPDGQRLGFVTRGTTAQLIVQTLDGQQQVLYSLEGESGSAAVISQLAWSPDGQQIAFTPSTAQSGEFEGLGATIPTLFIINTDGSNLRQFEVHPLSGLAWGP